MNPPRPTFDYEAHRLYLGTAAEEDRADSIRGQQQDQDDHPSRYVHEQAPQPEPTDDHA